MVMFSFETLAVFSRTHLAAEFLFLFFWLKTHGKEQRLELCLDPDTSFCFHSCHTNK